MHSVPNPQFLKRCRPFAIFLHPMLYLINYINVCSNANISFRQKSQYMLHQILNWRQLHFTFTLEKFWQHMAVETKIMLIILWFSPPKLFLENLTRNGKLSTFHNDQWEYSQLSQLHK